LSLAQAMDAPMPEIGGRELFTTSGVRIDLTTPVDEMLT
jgi:hypothetical protein